VAFRHALRGLTPQTDQPGHDAVNPHRLDHTGDAGADHWEREFPHYTPEQLFSLVSDIESFPIFMPGCLDAHIVEKGERFLRVENVFGVGPMHSRFLSTAELDPPHRIDISSSDGPWQHFHMCWQFLPSGTGCRVACTSSLEFRSPLLAALARFSRRETEDRIIEAFKARARILFGPHHLRR
jgi:coenzyme Q-binding protein COQ10